VIAYSSLEAVALSARAARLAVILEDWPRRTVALVELWSLWERADPASAGSERRRGDLAAALGELSEAGLLRASATVDRSTTPHLPTRITVPAPAPSPSAAAVAASVVWRPELVWATRARLSLGQVDKLRAVNTWLRDHGHETDILPLRERSLEVLGHEKALDRLMATSAFDPGRLTLGHLRTFRTHPPLPSTQVGDGPVLLVVENDNTFNSIRAALVRDPGPVGHVAWGVGGAFEASVRTCADLPGVRLVRYFGDIDADGLRIPRNAAATAAAENMPPVLPARELYRRLLATPIRQVGQPILAVEQMRPLVAWLEDPALMSAAADLLTRGYRIPQEALNARDLTSDGDWRDGL
jgi:Uncharacterized protein conserved in bacteria C-term(DUF2220)